MQSHLISRTALTSPPMPVVIQEAQGMIQSRRTTYTKNEAQDTIVRTTQQNKIPVYCWTLFHTYIKQAKKKIIEQQLHRQKKGRKKKETFYLWPF